jgi:hydrocephalus-inducing protein
MDKPGPKSTLQPSLPKAKQTQGSKTQVKLTPSQLMKQQMPGQTVDPAYAKPRITQFLNIGDFSINRESCVPIEEPLFEPIPSVISFTDYEPLQIKTVVFKLRNKDKVARTVRIIQPESRLFQVSLYAVEKGQAGDDKSDQNFFISGSKVAPGLEVKYLIKFSPEAKIDYNYDLHIVTERERFIVPIIAVGKRAIIDFPDMINFGKECPVKYVTEKPVIIRNLGDKTTKWELVLPNGFLADKKEGVLEFNRSEQIILQFYPVEKKLYEAEAILRYDGMEAFIPITGNAINGNVYLSKKQVKLGESYIGLENQRTIEIVNKSNVKIDFEWRTFETETEELEKKEMIKKQLDDEEQVQRLMLRDAAALEDNQELLDIQDDDDSGYEEVDERTLMLTNQKKAELLLQRRYKSIKKSIEENLFLFDHEIFDIKPVTGTIWPKSEMTITVCFRPQQEEEYKTHAFCNISCSDSRLSLFLEGKGLGPKAYLSSQSQNIKEVCVNEKKSFPLFIENKGDIPCKFTLKKNNTPFSKMIDFDVKEGLLEVGHKINFNMTFQSSKVGEFQEVFRWSLEGSKEELTLHVRGHVRAPEFEFKKSKIEFGVVSYQFEKEETIELENKSMVRFRFNLRIPGDNKNNEKEFEITPESDEIKEGETKLIRVKFMPHQKKDYFMVMVLDIEGVGKDMKSIPIIAKSDVPKVTIKDPVLEYNEVFLRDPKEKEVILINTSPLPARYKVLPQSPDTQMTAKIHTDNEEGIIPAYDQVVLKVTLTTLTINPDIQLDLGIKIIANEDKPLLVKLKANSCGPKVIVRETFIDFKDVTVLEDNYAKIHIDNCSNIKADFYAFTKQKDSIFKPIQRHHHLDAHSSMEIEIVCNADDTRLFNDTLHFVIKEGMDKEVKLRAKGVGKTIFCKENLDKIDFGTQYTFKQQTKEIFIENKGRRDQTLEWVRKKTEKKNVDDDKKKPQAKEVETEPEPTFSIFPETKLLPKKNGIMFQFRAVSTKKGKISETFILQSVIEGDRKPTKLFETEVCGEFINPKLAFDTPNIEFVYDWVKGIPPKIISQNIGISNDSVLPTKFALFIEKPFSIFPDNFDLSAYKKVTARLDFDPTYNTSKRSCVEKRQLKVKHSKHPFGDSIDVVGVFNFPNLELETHEINFGSVLNDTSKKVHMKMKNVSKMNVEYQWSFLEEDVRDEKDAVPINEIFDIRPLNGTLEPSQTETVEFVYNGLPGRKFETKAVCQIEGGPDEKVTLIGESSKIEYELKLPGNPEKKEIDFKEIPFSQWTSKEFYILNLGKVPFDFKVKTDNITRKGLLYIKPSAGKIAGGGKSKIKVHFCPGLPGDYLEKFKIQVAHFEAETIYLKGFGQYPALKFELNRQVDEDLKKIAESEGQPIDNISIDSGTTSITKKFPDGELISTIDRKILSEAVMKNIEERAKGTLALDISSGPEKDDDGPATTTGEEAAVPAANTTTRSGFGRTNAANKYEKHLYDNIIVGTYYLDLGNVIAGSSAQYQFRIYNVGKLPQCLVIFDQKNIRPQGFRLTLDRVNLKNKDKNYEDVRLIFQTKKNSPTGRQTFLLPVEIENGPKYLIEIRANVTVPEIAFSDLEVNFDKVVCGQKKIITLRIVNDKDVDCIWTIVQRKEQKKRATDPSADSKFTIVPSSGVLPPNSKQNLEITFIPTSDKNYVSTYDVSMEDNQRKLELICSGQGIIPILQFIPEEMVFEPSLPYDNNVYRCFEVKNGSEFDVEFYSLDFDKQYIEEDKMLVAYDPLQKTDALNMVVRKTGESLWPEVKNYYAMITENQRINTEIVKVREDKTIPEADKIQKIADLEKSRKVIKEEPKYPPAIEENERRYVVVWGPKGCGKTQLATYLAKEHQRGLVNFSEILQWNINSGTLAGQKAQEYLQKRIEERDLMVAEKEKAKKKAPKKKGQEEENLYLERYDWLTDEIMAALVRERLRYKDCGAGAVFDDIKGNWFENEMVAIKAICEACEAGTVQIVTLNNNVDEKGQEVCPIIYQEDIEQLEKDKEAAKAPKDDAKKKNKPLVDRKVIQTKQKEKERPPVVSVKDRKNAKEKAAKDAANLAAAAAASSGEENSEPEPIDPLAKRFDVDEIYQMTPEEIAKHKAKTTEFLNYFAGKIPDEQIHKIDYMFKKIEQEEEEQRLAKEKKKPAADVKKGASNKGSRPDTASKPPEPTQIPPTKLKAKREVSELPIVYNFKQLNLMAEKVVPRVEFPDPVTLPLPEPQILQILKKMQGKKPKGKVDNFEILTPPVFIKEEFIEKQLKDEFKDEVIQRDAKAVEFDAKITTEIERIKSDRAARAEIEEEKRLRLIKELEEEGKEVPEKLRNPEVKDEPIDSSELKNLKVEKAKLYEDHDSKVLRRKKELMGQNKIPFEPSTLQHQYRWIVPKGKSIILVLKFFSKKTSDFNAVLDFESIYSNGRVLHYKVKSICDFPKICTNPQKVFAFRRQYKPQNIPEALQKVFFLDENKFDFGPLLVGKKGKDKNEKKMLQVNSTTFDIINEGCFKANINFDLTSAIIEDPEYKKEIFSIHPNHMELQPGQTEKIRVWCIPDENRVYRDELVCMIEHNPTPFVIKMESTGASPVLSTSHKIIEFDRLLLNQSFTKVLTLKNIGLIPAKWKIGGLETLPPEFQFSVTSGELRPTKEAQIEIKFSSVTQKKFENEIKILASDSEEIGINQEPLPVALKAEAFNITAKLDGFGNPENILNFGDLEVGRRIQKTFTIKNEGLYDIKFNFAMTKKIFRDNFKIQPANGDIKPGETKEIVVVFKAVEETKINPAVMKSDMILEILEGKSSESFSKWPINVNVNAVYSLVSLNPPKQVNFGPVKFNEEATRSFEIRNDGLFEFNYTIFDSNDENKRKELREEQLRIQQEMDTLVVDEKGKKGKKDDKPKPKPAPVKKGAADPLALIAGQYTVTPSYGTIPPNSSVQVDVKFKAKGNQVYENKLSIDVMNRNPSFFPDGIPYELLAESCIPSINNGNFEAIFEEQIVLPSMTSAGKNIQDVVNSNVFIADERCFYFGTIIPSKHPEGVKERFKIINNGKVPSELKFMVRKKGAPNAPAAGGKAAEAAAAAEKDGFPFKVSPESAKIPPYEHIYVTVTFTPTIMASYSATFEAQVTNSDPTAVTMNSLMFDMRGEGAMPTLKLDKPKEWVNENTPILKFPKTRLGKRVVESIVLKNDGVIPATVKFDVTNHDSFRFISQTSYTLTPKSTQSFQIEYTPNNVGEHTWEVLFSTLLNPYENTKVIIKGECFFEGITFEGLPLDKDDQLIFGDVMIDASKKLTFFIKNHTDNDLRITTDIGTLDSLNIKPSIAHLNAKGTKTFHATLKSNKKLTLDGTKIAFKTEKIKQKDAKWVDWDNSRRKRKMISKTEDDWLRKCAEIEENFKKTEAELLSKGKKVPKRPDNYLPPKPNIPADEKKDIEIEETIPEPAYDSQGGEKKIDMQVFAKVDSARYVCDVKTITFAPTLMYSTRVYDFKMKNESITALNYRWEFMDRDGEIDSGFYKISPQTGVIRPEGEELFQVRFSPTEVEDDQTRRLTCQISNLSPTQEPPSIMVESATERPICHFELEASTYLSTRAGDIPEVDMSKLKVIEFESLGVKVKNKKRFYVVDPTASGYEFTWKRVDIDLGGQTNAGNFFTCQFEKGVILSGKKFEMIFEYKPEVPGLHESLWVFEIPTMNMKQYFLLVGRVIEPKVFFEVGKVDFGPLLLGGKNKETIKLKNLDYLPYQFNFNKASIKGDNDYGDSLSIEPLQGLLAAESEIPINITFKPKVEGQYNYNIVCNVAQKPRPLNLNVKGIGYMLHHSVHLNNNPSPLAPNFLNDIDFGNIFVNEKKIRTITIKNNGDFNFDFVMKKTSFNYVTVIPETATVKTGSKVDVEVIYNPLKDYKLRPNLHTLSLNIVSGPSYHFKLNGNARKPSVEVSFASHDFGPCFVLKNPIKKTVILKMKNSDDTAISIDPLFEKKNYLDVQLPPGQVLLPFDKNKPDSSILQIPIVFTPREVKKIDEIISFDINQLHKVDVRIMAEGVPLRLELKRTEDSFVDFGIVRVGSDNTAVVGLTNHSRADCLITFKVDKQLEELKKLCVSLLPDGNFLVPARETKDIEIRFNPGTRINSFRQELKYKIVENDEVIPLLTLQGACQGMDLKLMEEVLNFGSVVTGSKLTKKLQMTNMGDMGAKFDWDNSFCRPYFTITPKKGYIPPNDSVIFMIDFHPSVTEEHNFQLKCEIENGSPLQLTLIGKGVPQVVEGVQTLKFETTVRTKTSQKVSIKNPVAEKINIKANITLASDNFKGYFQGPESIQIGPNDKADYEITYLPLTMTANPKAPKIKETAHDGKLFFPMPDGSALMFNLQGKSNPPNATETTSISVKAKTEHVHTIKLNNWLKDTQRFNVSWEMDTKDESVIIKGANTIDVPAESVKNYKLTIMAMKQGLNKLTVTFRNPVTDEFVFYVISLTFTPPDASEVLEMSTAVRDTTKKVISITNPLEKPVDIKKEQITVDTDTITFAPQSFTIPPKSEFGLEINYRPLAVGESKGVLKINSPELGEFIYHMKLSGIASNVSK